MKLSLRGGLAYLLATAVFLILLITMGVFDPKPVGERIIALPATSLRVSQPGQSIQWLDTPLPDGDFSVRATAVFQEGTPDSGIGLALGGEADTFVVAVSPLGYVLVQQAGETVLPWQPWPHVRSDNASNEIWIDVRGQTVIVRLNREQLWQGNYLLSTRNIGLFGENFGETAVYKIPALEIFARLKTNNQ
jgi:hypothetical protein